MLGIYTWSVLITGIFFTSFGLFAYLKNKKDLSNKLFGLLSLAFAIWIFVLARLLLADNIQERLINGGLLIFLIISGILLIRSVLKEVRAREEIERLAKELEKANVRLKELDQAKSEFVTITSHQLRAPLTAMVFRN